MRTLTLAFSIWILAFGLVGATGTSEKNRVSYVVDTSRRGEHILHVSLAFPLGQEQSMIQLPTWYALYQIRDFSQYVLNVKAYSANNESLPIRSVDKTTWAVRGTLGAQRFEYDVRCNLAGPYGLEINADHLFINPAILLMYSPESSHWLSTIRFEGLRTGWEVETPLREKSLSFFANNYEDLADSPFSIGKFNKAQFTVAGAEVRVVVDAPPHTFDISELIRRDRQIVNAEADWMGGLPIKDYLFLYQFSGKKEIEGMEHSRATAIRVPVSAVMESMTAIDSVTAHEFFHLWNVMRIRPCSMEPVDYTHEQYSKALWFSEGVTSTVARYLLLRSGLLTEREYLDRLSSSISDFENTPARTWQSAEDASIAAWLSGYASYQASDRSIILLPKR